MNEEKITQTLIDKIKPVTTDSSVIENTVEVINTDISHNNLPMDSMVAKLETMQFLDIPSAQYKSTDTQERINHILKWAVDESIDTELSTILNTISKQLRIMGITHKEDKVERLYRYIKLHNIRKTVELQMRQLNG